VPSGDNAAASGALVVRVFTVVVGVLRAEAPPAGLPEGALVATVVGLLLVTFEAIGEGWLAPSSLAQYGAACDCDISVHIFIIIWRSLSGVNGGDRHGGWSGGACFVQVREESGTDGGMGKAALHIEQLTLDATLVVLYLRATPLEPFKLVNIGAVPMDVSYDSRVSKIDDSVVNALKCCVGGVEDAVIRIFRTRTSEIGGREGASVEGHGVDRSVLLSSPQEPCLISLGLE
jgi:hypothetical protein